MANPEHLKLLQQGVDVWNAWRRHHAFNSIDLNEAHITENLRGVDFRGVFLKRAWLFSADLTGANLYEANLSGADLLSADLVRVNASRANFTQAILHDADLRDAILIETDFFKADLTGTDFRGADLREVKLHRANLEGANLCGADLRRANLRGAFLIGTFLSGAKLLDADLSGATLSKADLSKADLSKADLSNAVLVETDLAGAILNGCKIYGVSAWNVKLSESTKQQGLIITAANEPEVTVDNIEVAQFVYLLLHNEKIRDVIDTVGEKGVLLLGRFTEGRIAVLNRLREELRKRGYLPIVFNFDKPETKDFTETVRLLAGLSNFVIADITNPRSAPLELQATVPEIMVPFRPIIEEGEKPFAMLQDLWIKHREWVFEPLYYSSLDALLVYRL